MSDFERYSPANVTPFEFADPAQQADVIKEAVEQRLGEAENGQHFSAVHVNRAFSDGGGATFVRLNSLFGSTANADQQYIASQYAAAFPEHGYLSLDLPAHGSSDRLTRDQRKAIGKNGGSLESVAAAQVEAAVDLIPNLSDIIVTGEGVAEALAVEFATQAAKRGITARHLFGVDPLGMEDRSPFALAASYLGNAQKSRNERRSEADDAGEQALEDAFSKVFVPQVEAYGPVKTATQVGHAGLMAKERTVVRLMFGKSPFTRATGIESLEAALEAQPELKAHLLFAGQSVVGRYTEPVQENLAALQREHDGRVQVDVWPYDNQDIGLARHQPRLVHYIKDNVEAV